MSPLWIGTSWKMTKTLAESRTWTAELRDRLRAHPELLHGVQPFVIPPFTAVSTVQAELGKDSPVIVGVQNAHWKDAGAWTGEISVPQAKDAGARIVEIGHSERREHFGETIATTHLKVRAALRHGLTPLLCIGEDAAAKESGRSATTILAQAGGALDGLDAEELAHVIIAYEPIWAIGEKGRPATVDELKAPVCALGDEYSTSVGGILYGGSVQASNAAELLGIEHLTGLFVGRAAWDIDGYLRILDIASRVATVRP